MKRSRAGFLGTFVWRAAVVAAAAAGSGASLAETHSVGLRSESAAELGLQNGQRAATFGPPPGLGRRLRDTDAGSCFTSSVDDTCTASICSGPYSTFLQCQNLNTNIINTAPSGCVPGCELRDLSDGGEVCVPSGVDDIPQLSAEEVQLYNECPGTSRSEECVQVFLDVWAGLGCLDECRLAQENNNMRDDDCAALTAAACETTEVPCLAVPEVPPSPPEAPPPLESGETDAAVSSVDNDAADSASTDRGGGGDDDDGGAPVAAIAGGVGALVVLLALAAAALLLYKRRRTKANNPLQAAQVPPHNGFHAPQTGPPGYQGGYSGQPSYQGSYFGQPNYQGNYTGQPSHFQGGYSGQSGYSSQPSMPTGTSYNGAPPPMWQTGPDQGAAYMPGMSQQKGLPTGSSLGSAAGMKAADIKMTLAAGGSQGPPQAIMTILPIQTGASTGSSITETSSPAKVLTAQLDFLQMQRGGMLTRRIQLDPKLGRRCGGQGVVAFGSVVADAGRTVAIKFFFEHDDFRRECEVSQLEEIKPIMVPVFEIADTMDMRSTQALPAPLNMAPLPPMIITEKGEPLDDFIARAEPDFFTSIQFLVHIAKKLEALHAAGWVHRDLKPGNAIWLPSQNKWSLIDFGCAGQTGREAPLAFSLYYAPPEVIAAYKAGQRTIVAHPAADVWALGVMTFELLSGTKFYGEEAEMGDVVAALSGEKPLVSEQELSPEVRKGLGNKTYRDSVITMLRRDPALRPTVSDLVRDWTNVFQQTSSA